MSLTTNKACVRFLRSTIMPALRPSPARSKPLSGDFCSRMQASARLAHIRSSQVPVPSFSSPTALHYCSSHCQPHRRPALLCSALCKHPTTPPLRYLSLTTYTCRKPDSHLHTRRPLSSPLPPRLDYSISLSLRPPSSPRRTRLADRIPCLAFAFDRRKPISYSLPWLANRPLASTSRLLLHIRLLRNGVESMHAPPPTAGRRQWLCALCDRATLAPNNSDPLLTVNFCSSSGNTSS